MYNGKVFESFSLVEEFFSLGGKLFRWKYLNFVSGSWKIMEMIIAWIYNGGILFSLGKSWKYDYIEICK